jgi:hypothetical protein
MKERKERGREGQREEEGGREGGREEGICYVSLCICAILPISVGDSAYLVSLSGGHRHLSAHISSILSVLESSLQPQISL